MPTKIVSEPAPETIVVVRRQWNDWHIGSVKFADLHHFHYRQDSGGVRARSPRPMLYAHMWCDALVEGEVAHSCEHGPSPHEILVCIVARDNDRALMRYLKEAATRRV
jgi:hypothetical protein